MTPMPPSVLVAPLLLVVVMSLDTCSIREDAGDVSVQLAAAVHEPETFLPPGAAEQHWQQQQCPQQRVVTVL